jgi:hypothetical protein
LAEVDSYSDDRDTACRVGGFDERRDANWIRRDDERWRRHDGFRHDDGIHDLENA